MVAWWVLASLGPPAHATEGPAGWREVVTTGSQPAPRELPTALRWGDDIVFAGGTDLSGGARAAATGGGVYDPAAAAWRARLPDDSGLGRGAAGVVGDHLLSWRDGSLRALDLRDPVAWRDVAVPGGLTRATHAFGASELWLADEQHAHAYDPETDQWRAVPTPGVRPRALHELQGALFAETGATIHRLPSGADAWEDRSDGRPGGRVGCAVPWGDELVLLGAGEREDELGVSAAALGADGWRPLPDVPLPPVELTASRPLCSAHGDALLVLRRVPRDPRGRPYTAAVIRRGQDAWSSVPGDPLLARFTAAEELVAVGDELWALGDDRDVSLHTGTGALTVHHRDLPLDSHRTVVPLDGTAVTWSACRKDQPTKAPEHCLDCPVPVVRFSEVLQWFP